MKILAVLTLLVFTFMINIGLACSCILPSPAPDALNDATAVFSGSVESINERRFFASTAEESVEVRFVVDRVWKGNISNKVTVLTAHGSASCGYEFEVGKQYLVYTHGEDELKVSLCSRTALLSDANDDILELGSGYDSAPSEKRSFLALFFKRIISFIFFF